MMSEPAGGGESALDKIFKKSATDKPTTPGGGGGDAGLSIAIRKLSGKIDGLPMAITTGIASSNITVKLKQ